MLLTSKTKENGISCTGGLWPWQGACGRAITPVSTYRTYGTTKEASRFQNSVHGVVQGKPEGPQLSNSLAGDNSSRG